MSEQIAADATSVEQASLPSLLRYATTWRVLAGWTIAYGLSSWVIEYFVSRLDPAAYHPFLFGLNRVVYSVVWSGAILVAIVATERLPINSGREVGRIVMHVVICLVVTILWGVLAYYACLAIVPGWQPLGVPKMLASTSKNVLFGYGLIVLLVHIILRVRLHRNQEVALLRQEHLAAQAQLQVLKLEIQPHFLFNALHSVSALIHSNPNAAIETLVLVSDMLRHAVDTSRVQEVPLRAELATLELYTQIQQVRFGDRLCLSWNVAAETLDCAVPHMLLQPLVENAIKHGVESHANAGKIIISSWKDGNALWMSIHDDGPGYSVPSPRRGAGLGIANVRSRLNQLYGADHSFTLEDARGGGTVVRMRIPFVLATRDANGLELGVVVDEIDTSLANASQPFAGMRVAR